MACLVHADSASHLRLAATSSLKPPSLAAPGPQRPTPSPEGRPRPARSPLDRRLSPAPSSSAPDRRPPRLSPSEKKHQNGTKTPSPPQKRLSGQPLDLFCFRRNPRDGIENLAKLHRYGLLLEKCDPPLIDVIIGFVHIPSLYLSHLFSFSFPNIFLR